MTNRYIHIIDNNQKKIASDPRCASPRTPTKSVEVEDCVGRGEFATAYPALSRICVCVTIETFLITICWRLLLGYIKVDLYE